MYLHAKKWVSSVPSHLSVSHLFISQEAVLSCKSARIWKAEQSHWNHIDGLEI